MCKAPQVIRHQCHAQRDGMRRNQQIHAAHRSAGELERGANSTHSRRYHRDAQRIGVFVELLGRDLIARVLAISQSESA
jgi:hypothetical protein